MNAELLSRAAASVQDHAILIVLPALLYAALATALPIAFAGRYRKDVVAGGGTLVAFALLGVVLGFFTGNARSSAVQALLPALLTFVAGMAAYLSTKDTLSSWRTILPFGMTAMLLAVVLSVSHGLALKQLAVEADREAEQRRLEYEKVQLEVLKQVRLRALGFPAAPAAAAGIPPSRP